MQEIGLNDSQAKAYLALVRAGSLTPPVLSQRIGVTRTNAYELLDQLNTLGLAQKSETGKKLTYSPAHPNALQSLVQQRREAVFEQEGRINAMMPKLLSFFYAHSDQPGVRFFQGRDGIVEVYKDILRTRQTVYLVRASEEKNVLGREFLAEYIKQRIKSNIRVVALTPLRPTANRDPKVDEEWLFDRTWFAPEAYTAEVEVDIYGDKVALISYGDEVMATIIQSPQIATAMKQLFVFMQHGAAAASAAISKPVERLLQDPQTPPDL